MPRINLKVFLYIAYAALTLVQLPAYADAITSNSRVDPDPIFTSLDPHYFLYTFLKDDLKRIKSIKEKPEWFSVSISPFGQNALCARSDDATSCANSAVADTTLTPSNLIEIGDINGRWAMIPLLFGPIPAGATLPPSLVEARNALFPTIPLPTPIDETLAVDPNKLFGFFSIPVEYRKRGVRFEIDALVLCDFGVTMKIGIAEITQHAKFNNLTCDAKITSDCSNLALNACTAGTTCCTLSFEPCNQNPNLTAVNVNKYLMLKKQDIFRELGYCIEDFHKVSAEDLRVGLFWRHAYPMNQNRKGHCWEEFLFMPFLQIEASFPVGAEHHYNYPFSVSFGSYDHSALGFNAGLSFDFTETIEFGGEAGLTHFFGRDFCNFPVPTSTCQSGVYPFLTNVHVQPGVNAHLAGYMSAYHFMGCLSFFFQYKWIRHDPDKICLKKNDCAFLPYLLEKRSSWESQVANIGFNYDITPYMGLGFFWQAPLNGRLSYRSTTVLFSFNAMF